MNRLDTNDIPGTLSVLQSDHSIVALCGSDGAKGTGLLQWEHWLTLSGLLVLPQSVYPASPSGEESGMLSFMRIQKVLKSDALIVITYEDADGRGIIMPEDMQLIVVALHAGKRVFTSNYVGRHPNSDAESDALVNIACPIRSLDLTAPEFLYELSWEDLRARDKNHKDGIRGIKQLPPAKVGSPNNGGTHGIAVAAQRSTPSEPEGYDPREPLQLTEEAIRAAQQPRKQQ